MRKLVFVAAAALAFAGCATKPATVSDRDRLEQQASSTLGQMRAKDAHIDPLLHGAYAYAVFPDVGKTGILFEKGVPTGYVKVAQRPAGAEGRKHAELLILRDQGQVDRLKQGELDSSAMQGATVFVMPRGSSTVEASITGQRIEFQPAG